MSKHLVPHSIWTNPIHFLAFGFGAGALPLIPGTWGTLIAIPLYLLICNLSLAYYIAILAVVLVAGVWICGVAERATGILDNSGIVWDEIAGFLLTMVAVPHGIVWLILGFLLFRIFDVWKPWPIGWLDRYVKGGLGIMLDDVVAAVYAGVILQILARIFVR